MPGCADQGGCPWSRLGGQPATAGAGGGPGEQRADLLGCLAWVGHRGGEGQAGVLVRERAFEVEDNAVAVEPQRADPGDAEQEPWRDQT